ncbi:MAG: non-hydrolyzing UDP-N-acetylglucosamine 2-epimerase [Ilumatobacteraceae bacterium]
MSRVSPKAVVVAGARPNFMKVAPLLPAFEAAGIDVVLVHTGQHYDPAMSDVFFEELGIRRPDHHLEVGSASHAVQTARIMEAFEQVVLAERPDWVVVVGDVNSTVACALVAAKLQIKVAHVEAGLRSRDWAMPEEVNRLVTDRLSDLLLPPSPDGVENLHAEGYADDKIELVGNVMVDTLLNNVTRAESIDLSTLTGLPVGQDYALLTLHRPSNVDVPEVFAGLLRAVAFVGERMPVIYPVHPRVRARFGSEVPVPPGVVLLDPVGYLASVALQRGARLVLTDSGGIQEETTILGVPCLTLRENTERPLTVDEGTNTVVGTDPEVIIAAVEAELASRTAPRRPALWDGKASERVAAAIMSRSRG